MIRSIAAVALFALVTTSSVLAQPAPAAQPPRPPQPTAPPPPPPPPPPAPLAPRVGQPVNVRVDVTITDQRAGTAPLKKTVSVVTADAQSGFIRSQAEYANLGSIPLNVDVQPTLHRDGKILVGLNLQYDLPVFVAAAEEKSSASSATPWYAPTPRLVRTTIRENLSLILESGKPMVAAQSADPVGDRQVTVEVTATILK